LRFEDIAGRSVNFQLVTFSLASTLLRSSENLAQVCRVKKAPSRPTPTLDFTDCGTHF
jgi:hypothetical protein